MSIELDHLILRVNDAEESVAFYRDVLGLRDEGRREPFSLLRVSPGLTLQLAAWGTEGGEHLAFAMDAAEFEATFERIRSAGIAYGDGFHSVGNGKGPGRESGSRGEAVYCFDPNRHLIEIRSYECG